MSKDISGSVAAPVSVVLSGKTYVFQPPTIADLKELELHLANQCVQKIKPLLNGLPLELQIKLLEDANEERKALKIGTKAFDERSMTIEGIQYLCWVCLRRRHPDITPEAVLDLMTAANMPEIERVIKLASGYSEQEADPFVSAPLAT